MNKENLIDNNQDGVPDDEMPELKKEDFAKAKPNRFANGVFQLDEDVSPYFKTAKQINEALRLLIKLNKVILHK